MTLDDLPDDATVSVPLAWLRARLTVTTPSGPENVTTGQAAKILGMSAKFWRMACEAGDVPGAWQEAPKGPWTFPLAAGRAYLGRRSKPAPKESIARSPWRKAS